MRLSRVVIENFRSIERMEIRPANYTTLIGPNNAGKSSVLRAIEMALNGETPGPEDWRSGQTKSPLVVELEFDRLAQYESELLAAEVLDGKLRLKALYTHPDVNEKKRVECTYFVHRENITVNSDDWPADAKWSNLSADVRSIGETLGINGVAFRKAETQQALRVAVRKAFPKKVTMANEWVNLGAKLPESLAEYLPQAVLIPAIRDAENDAKHGKGTPLGILLQKAILPAIQGSPEYENVMNTLRALHAKVTGEGGVRLPEVEKLETDLSNSISKLLTATAKLTLTPADPSSFIVSSARLDLKDSVQTRIGMQGHGMQRALVFALLELLAAQNAQRGERRCCTLVLFEEPELYIHPHLMRRLQDNLRSLSSSEDWQVIATTHSPFLVDVSKDPRSLVIHRRDDLTQGPTVIQLENDPLESEERDRLRALLDFHPTVCEAFFARRVVLVEGDTEMAVFTRQPKLMECCGIPSPSLDHTTLVSCDGKWSIVPIAKLLMAFRVPTKVIHDTDAKGRTQAELAANPTTEYKANAAIAAVVGTENVLAVDDCVEDLLWNADEPRSRKDKPYKAWQRVRELVESRSNLDHAPKLRDAVRFAYGTTTTLTPTAPAPAPPAG